MCSSAYRPRPDNGSGDSPRPPFLSEFVKHIGKLALVEVVYHLFGGTLIVRVHPHVERSIRLKTKSACGIGKLQTADADVGKQAVGLQSSVVGQTCKRRLPQLDAWPIFQTFVIPSEHFVPARGRKRSGGTCCSLLAKARGPKPG